VIRRSGRSVSPASEAVHQDRQNVSMGLQSGKGRSFRNPSGRSGRILPELRSSSSEAVARDTLHSKVPAASVAVSGDSSERDTPPPPEQDFCWAHVTGSYRRERAIDGMLYGAAVGDALGLGRKGLPRSSILRIYGRGPLEYCVLPGVGVVGADIHRMLMTLQSILRSRSQLESFRRSFANRLRCYLLTMPWLAGRATCFAALRLCLGASPDQSGMESAENGSLISGMAIANVLQGTGHSVERWVAICTETTHIAPEAVEAAVLIARTTYLAVMSEPGELAPIAMLDRLILVTEDQALQTQLRHLRRGLEEGLTAHEMASQFGWKDAVPATAAPTALMAIYAWLANHDSYERTVERAILLGGDTETLGVLAGGLAGIHLGSKSIPSRWLNRLWAWPNNRRWLDSMTKRFVDWPHGSEDLHTAPALPVRPVMQFIRSLMVSAGVGVGAVLQFPWKLSHRLMGS
jgi:ADP-ribosyl-[dinitrogen reductase] hydrolase